MHRPTPEDLDDLVQTLADMVYLALLERLECLKEGDLTLAGVWEKKCQAYLGDLEWLLVAYEPLEE